MPTQTIYISTGEHDGWVDQNGGYGTTDTNILAGTRVTTSTLEYRGLLSFDLSNIPAGAICTSSRIFVYKLDGLAYTLYYRILNSDWISNPSAAYAQSVVAYGGGTISVLSGFYIGLAVPTSAVQNKFGGRLPVRIETTASGTETGSYAAFENSSGTRRAYVTISYVATVSGSFSAGATLSKTTARSFAAGAVIRRPQNASLPADALVRSVIIPPVPYTPKPTVSVAIFVGGVDVSGSVVFAKTSFSANAAAMPGTCTVNLREPASTWTFTPGKDQIVCYLNGTCIYRGYLMQIEQGFTFAAAKVPELTLHGVDLNILFDKLIMYNHTNPNKSLTGGGTYKFEKTTGGYVVKVPKSTLDSSYIKAMVKDLDLNMVTPTIDTVSKVETVGQINPDGNFTPPTPGLTWRAFMEDVSANVARSAPGSSIWYINSNAQLVYKAQDTDLAPFWVGDADPSIMYNGAYGVNVKNLRVTSDVSHLKNMVLMFTGDLDPRPDSKQSTVLYVKNALTASLTQFGLFQYSETLTSDWLQGALAVRSNKVLYQEGGTGMRAEFTINQPGLEPGMLVQIVSDVHTFRWFDTTAGSGPLPDSYIKSGPSITLPVRSITYTFPTPTTMEATVTCSVDTQDPWGLILALKRPSVRGLSDPNYKTIDRTKTPPDPLEPTQTYTLVKEWPRPMTGGKWQTSYAYIRDSLAVYVNGLRRIAVPSEGTSVGFLQTNPDQGIFTISGNGTPYVEYHVWHGPLADE